MKHLPRPPEQDDLLRPRLVEMINQRHELVKRKLDADPLLPNLALSSHSVRMRVMEG